MLHQLFRGRQAVGVLGGQCDVQEAKHWSRRLPIAQLLWARADAQSVTSLEKRPLICLRHRA